MTEKTKKVIFCIPTITKPHQATLDALAASIPLIQAAGWEEGAVYEIGNPYISAARSALLRKAMDARADVVVFIDHDVSWAPHDLLRLIEADGELVAGTYRFKREPEEYMGSLQTDNTGLPVMREDGCLLAFSVPAGFLKITKNGINRFMGHYPELCFGDKFSLCVDLFNHGAHKGTWYGEDYAFSRRWNEMGGKIWVIPELNITHHGDKAYPGNFHLFLGRQAGGKLA